MVTDRGAAGVGSRFDGRADMKNTGAGIQNKETWRLLSFVREVQPGRSLELVIQDAEDGDPQKMVEEEWRDISFAKPQPDWKY